MTNPFSVSISPASVLKGGPVDIQVEGTADLEYQQIQVEVMTAGTSNPFTKLGFGKPLLRNSQGTVVTTIDTRDLDEGFYEIGLVRLHSPLQGAKVAQRDFWPNRDFPRQAFEVRSATAQPRTSSEVLSRVTQLENDLEQQFTQAVDVRRDPAAPGEEFTALAFVRDLLVGVRMRFSHFEILPTRTGLDSDDELRLVNSFLHERTVTGIQFIYGEAARDRNRRNSPVAVVHFPTLLANNVEEVRDYCAEQTNHVILALSLSRDAGGALFDTVVIAKATHHAVKFPVVHPYVGNLLTGGLSGENFQSVQRYVDGISDDANRFLVSLYKEARRERSRDFQYVRYWQILETLAERRNYDSTSPLLDFAGAAMSKDGKPLMVKGSVNIVFNLLRDNQIGDTEATWKNVNVWFAFRNAVAHHGAISQYSLLSRPSIREWAELGHRELQQSPDADMFLWSLKEDTKLMLMRRLVESSRSSAMH